jgi:hypothetical protein
MCVACRKLHKTRTLVHNGGRFEVDCGIADLIVCAWQHGIEIDCCCEGEDTGVLLGLSKRPQAFIGFPSPSELLKFLLVVAGESAVAEVRGFPRRQRLKSQEKQFLLRNGWTIRWSAFHSGGMIDFPPDEIPMIQSRFLLEPSNQAAD